MNGPLLTVGVLMYLMSPPHWQASFHEGLLSYRREGAVITKWNFGEDGTHRRYNSGCGRRWRRTSDE